MRSLLQLSETEPACKVPVGEATTGAMSMRLAPAVASLATEEEEVAEEAVVTAVEAAEAVEAEATILPGRIVCPLMESISLTPFAASPQTSGTSLATMAANRYSACVTVPTVNSLLPEEAEAEAVEEEAGAARLLLWRHAFRLLRQLPLLVAHRLVRSLLTKPMRLMRIKLALDLDLAVVYTNGDAVGVPDNLRVLPIDMYLPSGFPVFPEMLFRLKE